MGNSLHRSLQDCLSSHDPVGNDYQDRDLIERVLRVLTTQRVDRPNDAPAVNKANIEVWSKLLPIVVGFVRGDFVQKRDYNNRWVHAGNLHSVLSTGPEGFRLQPVSDPEVEWTRRFQYRESGSVDGCPIGEGVFRVKSKLSEPPIWPGSTSIKWLEEPQTTFLLVPQAQKPAE